MVTVKDRNGKQIMERNDLEEYADWLQHPNGRHPKGAVTIRDYLYIARRFHGFLEGKEPDEEKVQDFIRYLEKGSAPRSRAWYVYGLQSYFAFRGVELGIKPPAFTQPSPRWLTDEERFKLLEVAEKDFWDSKTPRPARARAALMIYGVAGLRLSEGCALRREGVDHRGYLRILRKSGEERIVPVEAGVVIAIQEWMNTHDSPWVFPGKDEGPIHRRTMQTIILSLMKKAEIKNVSHAVDMLRNTVAMNLSMRSPHGSQMIYRKMASEELRKQLDGGIEGNGHSD